MDHINSLVSKLILFHNTYISETIIFPDQFGNYSVILFFYFLLLFSIFIFRNDSKKIRLIFFLFVITLVLKTTLFYSKYSSCQKIDSDGYTAIANWSSPLKSQRLHSNLININGNQKVTSLIKKNEYVLFVFEKSIYSLKNNKRIKLNFKLDFVDLFNQNGSIYGTDINNNLFLINDELGNYEKKYSSKYLITNINLHDDVIYVSTINGKIINIQDGKQYFDFKIPIKKFFFIKDSLFILNFNNELHQFKNKKFIKKIKFTNNNLGNSGNIGSKILKTHSADLELIEDLFKKFEEKEFSIKLLDIYRSDLIVIFENGKVSKFKNINEAIKIANDASNRHDLEKKIEVLLDLGEVNKFLIHNDFLFLTNFHGDFFKYHLLDNQKYKLYNSQYDFEEIESFFGYKIHKNAIRLPGYPLVSSFLMTNTQIFNACNIIVLQHLILIMFLIMLLLSKIKKIKSILIFLMIIFFYLYNYLSNLISQDNPHFFEMIFFSLFIYLQIFLKKKLLLNIFLNALLIVLSSLLSTKILIAMFIFLFCEMIYFLILIKKSNYFKLIRAMSYMVLIFINVHIVNNYFQGQKNFNQTNISQQIISYLMLNNSTLYDIDKVNDYKKIMGLKLEKEISYGNYNTGGFNRFPIFAAYLSNFDNKNIVVDLHTGKLIKPIDEDILKLILLSKKDLLFDFAKNFIKNIEVLISISDIQKKNSFFLVLSFIIFLIGLTQSSKFYKEYNLILLLSMLGLYSFYSAVLVPQSRFFLIYNIYLYSIYYFGLTYVLKNYKYLFKKLKL